MWTVAAIFVGYFVLRYVFRRGDGPNELSAAVWHPDHEERARRLAEARAAWKAGRPYFSPEAIERLTTPTARGALAIADPNAEAPERRLVRRHPMRPATWE